MTIPFLWPSVYQEVAEEEIPKFIHNYIIGLSQRNFLFKYSMHAYSSHVANFEQQEEEQETLF